MSATPLPTKTSGERPPVFPPIGTAFDGAPDDGDSWLTRLTDDVRMVCRHADAASGETLETMIQLLDARKQLIVLETLAQHATETYALPPMIDFAIEYLSTAPTGESRQLNALLTQIEECRARCERRLARHRFEVRLLKDLGASDS